MLQAATELRQLLLQELDSTLELRCAGPVGIGRRLRTNEARELDDLRHQHSFVHRTFEQALRGGAVALEVRVQSTEHAIAAGRDGDTITLGSTDIVFGRSLPGSGE